MHLEKIGENRVKNKAIEVIEEIEKNLNLKLDSFKIKDELSEEDGQLISKIWFSFGVLTVVKAKIRNLQ